MDIVYDYNEECASVCMHDIRDSSNACVECGVYVSEFYGFEKKTGGKKSNAVIKEIKNLDYPPDIISSACDIYTKITRELNTKNTKSKIMFYCVLQAHMKEKEPVEPTALGEKFGLDKSKIRSAITLYNKKLYAINETYTSYIEPSKLITNYSTSFGFLSHSIDDIIQLYESVCKGLECTRKRSLVTVVAGVIYYYMNINGISVSNEEYASTFKIAFSTINTMHQEISKEINRGTTSHT